MGRSPRIQKSSKNGELSPRVFEARTLAMAVQSTTLLTLCYALYPPPWLHPRNPSPPGSYANLEVIGSLWVVRVSNAAPINWDTLVQDDRDCRLAELINTH